MTKARAVEEPYINELKGSQVAANNFFTVSDEKYNNTTSWNLIQQHYSVDNIITFEINFDTTVFFYNTPFSCTVNFKIYVYGNVADTINNIDSTTYSNISLTVRYDTVTGKLYKGIAMYKFTGAHRYKVKILSVSSAQLGSTPVIFRLKGQIIINRQYKFEDNSTDITRFAKVNTNQLQLEWTPSNYPGAEMFDLEYTFIDSSSQIASSIRTYNTGGYYYVPTDSLKKWFRNNNTRITTAASGYLMNVPYDSGYVLFRMRGVQDSLGVRIEGNWNYAAKTATLSCTTGCPAGVVFFAGHEVLLNWQYSVVFAEEGKRKEVISYFDGSLRNRQSVTLTNTDNKNIVQETIYDALGRPAVNILPAPTNDSTIHYFRGFNKNSGGTNPYSFSDLGYASCTTSADSVSYSSGTGKYYSTGNSFLTNYYYAKYIPNAGGYPFIVTEYMADNTGRIKAQGGVGAAFQLGSDHETRYYYGKPTQTELDRLFGLEAGNASHYLKNMVVDPNGQVSVSYMDAGGRTIATALAGGGPSTMHQLPSASGASVTVTNDLIVPGDFERNAGSGVLTASATFLAPVTGTYIFNYRVDSLTYRKLYGANKDSSICSHCYYDLEILIKNDCEDTLRRDTVAAGNVFDTACASPPASIKDSIHVSISKIGEYYVTYNLFVSSDALTYYDSVHLAKNTDIKKLNYFLREELKNTDFYGCYSECKTCLDRLGEKTAFVALFQSMYLADSIQFYAEDSALAADLYDSLFTYCKSIQSGCGANVCDEKLEMLKMDVRPGGQYALYDTTDNSLLETPINVLAKRNQITFFRDQYGNPDTVTVYDLDGEDSVRVAVTGTSLSDSMFISRWKDSWADSLVKLHPEYCFYLWCVANSSSYEFDEEIENWRNADTAMARGWFYPPVYDTILAHDPFFMFGGNGYSLRNKMKDSLRLFSRTMISFGQSDKNILKFIDLVLYCRRDSSCNVWDSCTVDDDCRSRNREWFMYKNFYLNLKQLFYERARRTSTDTIFSNCSNCFIGKDLTEYFPDRCVDTCFNNNFQKLYGGSGDDFGYDAKTLTSGGIVVAGKTNSFGNGGYDGYIIKLNNRGEVQWSKTIGGTSDDVFNRIKLTRDRGYIAIGTTKSYGHAAGDILVTKLTANGSISWSKRFGLGSATGEQGRDICQTADGNYVLCAAANKDTSRIILAKLNSAGTILWSKKYNSSAVAEAMDILADGDTVVISGHYYSASNYFDGFLLKVNHTNGSVIWTKGYEIAGLNNYVSEIYLKNNQYYFKSRSTPSISNQNDTIFTVLSADRGGTIQLKRDINTSHHKAGSMYPDNNGNVVIGMHDSPGYSTDILNYFKMNSAGNFPTRYLLPKQAGYAIIEKTIPAPGNTSVLAGHLNPETGYDDEDIYIFKTSADPDNFTACGFSTTSVSSSEPSVTTSSLSWSADSISISLGDSTIGSSSPSTVTDTLCSYFTCNSPLNCDTTNWEPFVDSLCVNNNCDGGVHNPYDRDSLSFYIEYGSAHIAPTAVPSGYAGCRFYNEFVLHTGVSTVCRFTNVWVCVKDSTCPGGSGVCNDSSYSSHCEASGSDTLYRNKIRRYPEYVNPYEVYNELDGINPQQESEEMEEQILLQCQQNCDAQADTWMNILRRCNNMSSSDSTALRAAFVDICSKGCSIGNPFGTSSIPNTISATYHSFEEAITAIIGSPAPNDSCTQELLSLPYPYNRQTVYLERLISETDSAICAKLSQRNDEYNNSGYGGSFHSYLLTTYGTAYPLDSLELDDLQNSCNYCNYILKDDIILPIILDPLAGDCLRCDSLQASLTAFENKFPNIDSTDDDYELLFTNFFNHHLGFSLTFERYRNFLDSCDAHPGDTTSLLCNQQMMDEQEMDPNSCTRQLFANALSNATSIYIAYIDSVRRDFQEAWTTKCMNAQPLLTMTASLYEYHYTLYYYDQSGNLVKTIPPEGVQLLDNTSIASLQAIRNGSNPACSNNNSMVFTNGSVNFPGGTTNAPQLNVGSDPFTIETWINLSSLSNQGIFSNNHYSGSYNTGYSLAISSSKLLLFMGENSSSYKVEAASPVLSSYITLNAWTHIAVQRTSISTVKMFINGNEVPVTYTSNTPNTGNLDHSSTDPFYTGASNKDGSVSKLSSGKLRHVRIYKRALPATEIRQNYNNFCGNPSGYTALVLWETFTEGSFTTSGGNDYVYERIYNAAGQKSSSVAFETTGDNTLVPEHRLVTIYQYNSLNQVLQQYSPDGDTSKFYYDRLGRLIASQNKEQKDNSSYSGSAYRYSYTLYDSLGRIKEVGEKSGADSIHTINLLDTADVNGWLASGTDRQVTKTIYDDPVNINLQDYNTSRKRVVASIYLENKSDGEGDSTLYSYDILGNVKTLLQHVKALVAVDNTNGRKRIDYEYDLVSGKVNRVSYQHGKGDQFYYKYSYDADNRVTRSYSSRDKLVWVEDASYNYYLHGPLARSELGHYKVQGIDYTYTLQGWLKGINSDSLTQLYDMANDGKQGTTFARVSRDVYGFKLGYYNSDYTAIGGSSADAFSKKDYTSPGSLEATGNQLFNGNISFSTLALSKINSAATTGYSYGYDQLNRLTEMRQHTTGTSSGWSNSNIITAYRESITYDANGNILKYLRKGTATTPHMDSLTYKYTYSSGNLVNNKLNHVKDSIPSGNYSVDIDDQSADNYVYDKIGNLKKDVAESIDTIRWTVYGKINRIVKSSGATLIDYKYDPGGNRTSKKVTVSGDTTTTFYIRDAQGNVLGMYSKKNSVATHWDEQHLYGSSRLGMWNWDTIVPSAAPVVVSDPIYDSLMLGSRTYELTNHLGNVLSTISDKKIGNDSSGTVNYYIAEVLSQNDYYPGGMLMPGRKYGTLGRYGFNGKEQDSEVKGEGNSYDFGARIYDPRIVRFLSIDPLWKDNVFESNYVYANANPILMIDREGKNGEVSIVKNQDGKGGVINITTTVYVTGHQAKENVAKINQYLQSDKGKGALSGTYSDKDGNNWKINLSITYKVKEETDKVLSSQNDLTLTNDDKVAVAGTDFLGNHPADPEFTNKKGSFTRRLAGQNAFIGVKSYTTDFATSAIHETLHLLGLDERYDANGDKLGFEGDVMGSSADDNSILKINQAHFNNWGRFALAESERLGKDGVPAANFILKNQVDKDGNKVIGNYVKDKDGKLVIEDQAKNLGYEPPKPKDEKEKK